MKLFSLIAALLLLAGSWYITNQDACEDAHILFRVSQSLASGDGLTYNAGIHVEAATEFLWMALLSWFTDIPTAAQYLGYGLAAALALLLWWNDRPAWILALSPLMLWAHSGLGTPLFALFLAGFVILAEKGKHDYAVWCGVLAALTRSEVLPLLIIIMLFTRAPWRTYVTLLSTFAVYWGWRWAYFGTFWPHTWTAKGLGSFSLDGYSATLLWLVCSATLLVWRRDAIVIAVMLFPLGYLFTDQQTNIGLRFQFAYLPALIALMPQVRTEVTKDPVTWRYALPAAVLLVLFAPRLLDWTNFYDDRAMIGENLSKLPPGTLLTTEAGWLPFYSGWGTIDALGLADTLTARHAGDTAILYPYFDKIQPDLIMWHCYNGTVEAADSAIQRFELGESSALYRSLTGKYKATVRLLYDYCQARGYKLVAIANSLNDCRWYWLRTLDPRLVAAVCDIKYPFCGQIAR